MSKLCMNCFDTFKDDAVTSVYKQSPQGLYQECPRRVCNGRVHQIDDTILPAVQILNMKGYKTHSSCGGHMEELNPEVYIEFDESVRSLPELPYGFQQRYILLPGNKKRIVVFQKVDVDDYYSVFEEILEIAHELYNWAVEIDIAEEVVGTTIMFIDPELMNMFEYGKEGKTPEKNGIDKDKIKDTSGTIKLNTAKKVNEETKEDKSPEPDSEIKKEEEKPKPSKKRGRPKKEDK